MKQGPNPQSLTNRDKTLATNSASLEQHWGAKPGNQAQWIAFSNEVIEKHSPQLADKPTLFKFYRALADRRYEIGQTLGHNDTPEKRINDFGPEVMARINRLHPAYETYGLPRENCDYDHQLPEVNYETAYNDLDDKAYQVLLNRLVTMITHVGKYEDQLLPLTKQLRRLAAAKTVEFSCENISQIVILCHRDNPQLWFPTDISTDKFTFYFGGTLSGWQRKAARYSKITLTYTAPLPNFYFPPHIVIEHMSGDLIDTTFQEIEALWQKLLNWNGEDVTAFERDYHQLMWYLAQMTPLCLGSAAVSNWVLQSLRTFHHKQYGKTPIEHYLPVVNWDLIAIATESPEKFSETIHWLYPKFEQEQDLLGVPADKVYAKAFAILNTIKTHHCLVPARCADIMSQLKALDQVWFLSDEAKVQQLYGYFYSLKDDLQPEAFKDFKQECDPSLIAVLDKFDNLLTISFDKLTLSNKGAQTKPEQASPPSDKEDSPDDGWLRGWCSLN